MDNTNSTCTILLPTSTDECFFLDLPRGAFLAAPMPLNTGFYDRHVEDVAAYNLIWDQTDGFKTRELATIKPGH